MCHPNVPGRKRCGITKAFRVGQPEHRIYSSGVYFASEKRYFLTSSENKSIKILRKVD